MKTVKELKQARTVETLKEFNNTGIQSAGVVEFRSKDIKFINKETPDYGAGTCYGDIPKEHNLIKDAAGNITGWFIVGFNDEKIGKYTLIN